MTDKIATEDEVRWEIYQKIVEGSGNGTYATAHTALHTALAMGCLLPEEAEALRDSLARLHVKADQALERRDEKARGLDDMATERDALAALLKVAEEALATEALRLQGAADYCRMRLKRDAYRDVLNAIVRGDHDKRLRNPCRAVVVASDDSAALTPTAGDPA